MQSCKLHVIVRFSISSDDLSEGNRFNALLSVSTTSRAEEQEKLRNNIQTNCEFLSPVIGSIILKHPRITSHNNSPISHNVRKMESYCKPPKNLSFHGDLSENWRKFQQNFEIFLKASRTDKEEGEVKVALLLNFVGEEGVELYNTFNLEGAERHDLEKVVQAFQEYCCSKKNVMFASCKFFNRTQVHGETLDCFLTDLERLCKTCEYGSMKDRLIRDRFVSGIRDKDVQQSLLKIHDLDLQKAVDLCRAAEASKTQTKTLEADNVRGSKQKKDNGAKRKDVKQQTEQNVDRGRWATNKARRKFGFSYTVENFSKMEGCKESWPRNIWNLPWKILVSKDSWGQKNFGFKLLACGESDSWGCYAEAELRLLSNKEGIEPFSRKIEHFFYSGACCAGFSHFISWENLLDVNNGYIKDDSITLEVHGIADMPIKLKYPGLNGR